MVRFSMPLRAACSGGQLDDPLHEDPRQVDLVGTELADLYDPFRLDDGDPPRHRRGRVEVACGRVESAVAGGVDDRRADQA